jgi:hypothetical protein
VIATPNAARASSATCSGNAANRHDTAAGASPGSAKGAGKADAAAAAHRNPGGVTAAVDGVREGASVTVATLSVRRSAPPVCDLS